MEGKELEISVESAKSEKSADSKDLKVLAENSKRRLLQIQSIAAQKLEQIRHDLSLIDEKSSQFQNLKLNEQFYTKALEECQRLNKSINEKVAGLELVEKETPSQYTSVHDVIVNIDLKDAPYQEKSKENEARDFESYTQSNVQMINQLRGLTPGQNLFIRQKSLDSLTYQETDILTSAHLSETEKIGGLRSGMAVAQLIRQIQNNNQRSERQLPMKERQRVRQFSRTRGFERGSRKRG